MVNVARGRCHLEKLRTPVCYVHCTSTCTDFYLVDNVESSLRYNRQVTEFFRVRPSVHCGKLSQVSRALPALTCFVFDP